MDIDAMAKAMFDAFHARFDRVRNWARHNNQDVGPEHGRDTFRTMAQAVAAILEQPSPVDEPAPVVEEAASVDEGQKLNPAPILSEEESLDGHD